MPRNDCCSGGSAVSSCSRRLPRSQWWLLLLIEWALQLHAEPILMNRRAKHWTPSPIPSQALSSTNVGSQQHVVGSPFGEAVQASSLAGFSREFGRAPAMGPMSLVPQESQVVPPMVPKRAPFTYSRAQPVAFASLVAEQEDFRQAVVPRGAPDVVGTAGLLPTGSTYAISDTRGTHTASIQGVAATAFNGSQTMLEVFRGVNMSQSFQLNGDANPLTDLAMCASSTHLLVATSQLVSVRAVDPKQDAQLAAGPVSMFSFFAASPAEAMTFYSPQCVYDRQSSRFVVAVLRRAGMGANLYSSLALAVSQTSNPLGSWNVYEFDARGRGDASCSSGSPCFPQSLSLGQDAHSLWMAVNLFGESGNFVSAKIWGCGKPALGQAASGAFTSWSNLTASSLQASDCLDAKAGQQDKETQFFLYKMGSAKLGLLGVSATKRLSERARDPPSFSLAAALSSQPLLPPPIVDLGDGAKQYGGDGRLQSLFLSKGRLYAAGGAGVPGDRRTAAGLAYYVLDPRTPAIQKQGVYAPQGGSSLLFPSAVPDESGQQLMVVGLLTGLPALPLASAFASLNLTSGRVEELMYNPAGEAGGSLEPKTGGSMQGHLSAITSNEQGVVWGGTVGGQSYAPAKQGSWGVVLWQRGQASPPRSP